MNFRLSSLIRAGEDAVLKAAPAVRRAASKAAEAIGDKAYEAKIEVAANMAVQKLTREERRKLRRGMKNARRIVEEAEIMQRAQEILAARKP